MNRVPVLASVLCFATTGMLWLGRSGDGPSAVDAQRLESIRAGAWACAVNYTPTGAPTGCNQCLYHGPFTFMFNGFPVTINVWKRCKSQEPDDFCVTGETYLSWCDKASTACADNESWVYQDANCEDDIDGYTSCTASYLQATATPDGGLTCTGVGSGMY